MSRRSGPPAGSSISNTRWSEGDEDKSSLGSAEERAACGGDSSCNPLGSAQSSRGATDADGVVGSVDAAGSSGCEHRDMCASLGGSLGGSLRGGLLVLQPSTLSDSGSHTAEDIARASEQSHVAPLPSAAPTLSAAARAYSQQVPAVGSGRDLRAAPDADALSGRTARGGGQRAVGPTLARPPVASDPSLTAALYTTPAAAGLSARSRSASSTSLAALSRQSPGRHGPSRSRSLLGVSLPFAREWARSVGLRPDATVSQVASLAREETVGGIVSVAAQRASARVYGGGAGVGMAVLFVSHAQDMSFVALLDSLEDHLVATGRDVHSHVWIAALCAPQAPPASAAAALGTVASIQAFIGHTIAVVDASETPAILTRAWCLFELLNASVALSAPGATRGTPQRARSVDAGRVVRAWDLRSPPAGPSRAQSVPSAILVDRAPPPAAARTFEDGTARGVAPRSCASGAMVARGETDMATVAQPVPRRAEARSARHSSQSQSSGLVPNDSLSRTSSFWGATDHAGTTLELCVIRDARQAFEHALRTDARALEARLCAAVDIRAAGAADPADRDAIFNLVATTFGAQLANPPGDLGTDGERGDAMMRDLAMMRFNASVRRVLRSALSMYRSRDGSLLVYQGGA